MVSSKGMRRTQLARGFEGCCKMGFCTVDFALGLLAFGGGGGVLIPTDMVLEIR